METLVLQQIIGSELVMVTAYTSIVGPGLISGYGRGIVEVYYRREPKESDLRILQN